MDFQNIKQRIVSIGHYYLVGIGLFLLIAGIGIVGVYPLIPGLQIGAVAATNIALPDIQVSLLPVSVKEGESMILHSVIGNGGLGSINKTFYIRYQVDYNSDNKNIKSNTLRVRESVPSGALKNFFSGEFVNVPPGSHRMKVCADEGIGMGRSNRIPETNNDNNCTEWQAFSTIQVTEAPQPQVASSTACHFPSWKRVSGNPVHKIDGQHLSPLDIATDPSVLYEDGKYKMWFTNADSTYRSGAAYAESKNGITWTVWKKATNPDPIIDLALKTEESNWDGIGIETVDVLKTPDGYRMYYTGNKHPEGSYTYAIGLATSKDGINWVRQEAPVLESLNAWERPTCSGGSCHTGGVLEPSVLYDASTKTYKMWYAGLGEKDGITAFRIGYATSNDGINWQRRANPVLDIGTRGSWDDSTVSHVNVVKGSAGGYHLFYAGSLAQDYVEGVDMQKTQIGHAYSADGITWQRNPKNPILAPTADWEGWAVGGPSAINKNGSLEFFYFGNRNTGYLATNIGSVQSTCQ